MYLCRKHGAITGLCRLLRVHTCVRQLCNSMLDLTLQGTGQRQVFKQQLLAFEEYYVFVRSAQLSHSGKGREFYCSGMPIPLSLDKRGVPVSNTTKITSLTS